jgi:protein-S-isoprenylcysteine O-methyltransferase Ste14
MKPPLALLVALAAQAPLIAASWPLRPPAAGIAFGSLLVAAGIWLNIAAERRFRGSGVGVCPFSQTPALITDGPYRITRNPMYLGLVLLLLGTAFLTGVMANAWTAAAYAAWIHKSYVMPEEDFLRRLFGADFNQYAARTPRWLGDYSMLRNVIVFLTALVVVGMVLLWAWNTVAVGLFSAPVAQFKHALAFEMGIVALFAIPRLLWRCHTGRA